MIVDCHTHVAAPEHHAPEFVEDLQRSWGEVPWSASTLDDHWAAMEPVDVAVVLALDAPASGYVVPNDYVAAHVARHPDKLIGFASVDPNRPDALERLDQAVALGLRGLKVGPVYQNFDPLGEAGMAVFRSAQRLGLPVLCHQGTTFLRSAPLRLARPFLLDEVARRCPELVIVIAHLGHPWCEETMAVIRKHPYLYSDVSALHTRPFQLYQALVAAAEYRVFDKLLFGSDYPFATPTEMMDALRAIPLLTAGTGLPAVSAAQIEEIIHRPTLEVLGLDRAQ